ncbi:ABC transporter permease, partial [Metapseudomonas otitidis]
MIFDYTVIYENLPLYFSGVLVTLKLLAISLAVGLLVAVPLALMRVSKQPMVNFPAWLYTYVIRGTPMLVQLFLIYYGLAQFEAVRASWLWPYLSNATFCACLAFAINTSAYTAEILAGSLKATPHGEIEAAKAIGMSRAKLYRRILLPSALRRALPQYSNEVIMMLHTTSLASIVTLVDITGAAR